MSEFGAASREEMIEKINNDQTRNTPINTCVNLFPLVHSDGLKLCAKLGWGFLDVVAVVGGTKYMHVNLVAAMVRFAIDHLGDFRYWLATSDTISEFTKGGLIDELICDS